MGSKFRLYKHRNLLPIQQNSKYRSGPTSVCITLRTSPDNYLGV